MFTRLKSSESFWTRGQIRLELVRVAETGDWSDTCCFSRLLKCSHLVSPIWGSILPYYFPTPSDVQVLPSISHQVLDKANLDAEQIMLNFHIKNKHHWLFSIFLFLFLFFSWMIRIWCQWIGKRLELASLYGVYTWPWRPVEGAGGIGAGPRHSAWATFDWCARPGSSLAENFCLLFMILWLFTCTGLH